jgi:hypothetical protein
MSGCALFEIDVCYGRSGKSVLLAEQVRELPTGWPVWGVPQLLYSDIAVLALGTTGVAPSRTGRAWNQCQKLLTRAGGGLTATEIASRLGVDSQRVGRLRETHNLLAVPDPNGNWLYPACQFEGNEVTPGLKEVLSEFAVTNPWTRLYVLISHDSALSGRSPIEALRDGDLEAVRRIVRGYGQQGAA